MAKRYALHPGEMQSKFDGQIHYIGSAQLAQLYQVPLQDCIIVEYDRPDKWLGCDLSGLIHLHPRYHGDYTQPATEVK